MQMEKKKNENRIIVYPPAVFSYHPSPTFANLQNITN